MKKDEEFKNKQTPQTPKEKEFAQTKIYFQLLQIFGTVTQIQKVYISLKSF